MNLYPILFQITLSDVFFIFRISVSQLLEAFVKKYGGSATYVSRAPGRVNLIGTYVYLKAYMCFPEVFHCRESFRENHFQVGQPELPTM